MPLHLHYSAVYDRKETLVYTQQVKGYLDGCFILYMICFLGGAHSLLPRI